MARDKNLKINTQKLFGVLTVLGFVLLEISAILIFSSSYPDQHHIMRFNPSLLAESVSLACWIFGTMLLTIGVTGFVRSYSEGSTTLAALAIILTPFLSVVAFMQIIYLVAGGPL
jgi:hypothetical protein